MSEALRQATDELAEQLAALQAENARLREALEVSTDIISTYHEDTPLGHQPHMIALLASDTIYQNRQILKGNTNG